MTSSDVKSFGLNEASISNWNDLLDIDFPNNCTHSISVDFDKNYKINFWCTFGDENVTEQPDID